MDDQHPPPTVPSSSTAPQIRSRITVVCAECKRLKLKCDRRTPCGSCTKRDTVSRCIYSPAAAEKVDLHSINNRLIQVETLLAMITSGKTPPPFQSSYPLAQVPVISPRSATTRASHVASTASSISIRQNDLVNIWLAHCQLDVFTHGSRPTFTSDTPLGGPYVKLEQSPIELLQMGSPYHESTNIIDDGHSPSASTKTTQHNLPPLHLYHIAHPPNQHIGTTSAGTGQPSATPAVFSHLPSSHIRARLLKSARSASSHLSLLVNWTRVSELADPAGVAASRAEKERQKNLAAAVFFGAREPSLSPPPTVPPNGSPTSLPLFACMCYLLALGALEPTPNTQTDHSFLYALAGQAIGIWEEYMSSANAKEEEVNMEGVDAAVDATAAKQTEKEREDLDYVVALLLQVKYLLRTGSSKHLADTVFPLTGKLVNTARGLGLARDPEEERGVRRSLKAEERRRVIWWDIMFYDIFTSDVLNHSPLVSSNSYTTRAPSVARTAPRKNPSLDEIGNVGDDSGSSGERRSELELEGRHGSIRPSAPSKGRISSRLIPPPKVKGKCKAASSAQDDADMGFFGVRCRLTCLAQTVKHRLASPGCDCCSCGSGYTLDHAAKLESEIRSWVADLPTSLRLEHPSSDSKSPKHAAIAAELSILANRLIISAYVPLMRPSQDGTASSSAYSAVHPWSPASRATIEAAQGVVQAARVLHRLAQAGIGPPFMGNYYPLRKAVIDSLVICAHSGLASTKPGRNATLMEEVFVAFEVLDTMAASEGELARLVSSLRRRTESGNVVRKSSDENALKRKHAALEDLLSVEQSVDLGGRAGEVVDGEHMSGRPDEARGHASTPQQEQHQPHYPVIPPPPPRRNGSVHSSHGSDKKQKKGYSAYPAIGFRDRGKDNAPWMTKKANANLAKSELITEPKLASSPAHETSSNYQPSPQHLPVQHAINKPMVGNGHRSRSSSITQPPRLHTSDFPARYVEERDADMHTSQRRRFSIDDSGQHQLEQTQQPFIVPPTTQYDPSQQSSRDGSFDAPHGSFDQGLTDSEGAYGGPQSPYTNSSGLYSDASSPYGSTSGHPQSTAYASQHPSPPTFVSQPAISDPQSYYQVSSGYKTSYEGQAVLQQQVETTDASMAMQSLVPPINDGPRADPSLPSTPVYEKTSQQLMYDIKMPVDMVQLQQQQMHHYQVPDAVDHLTAPHSWPPPTPQYMQQQQQSGGQQDMQYWTTGPTYYQ